MLVKLVEREFWFFLGPRDVVEQWFVQYLLKTIDGIVGLKVLPWEEMEDFENGMVGWVEVDDEWEVVGARMGEMVAREARGG